MGFTSLDKLVAALGEYQPWVASPVGKLLELVGDSTVLVVLDPHVDADAVRWTEDDLKAVAEGHEVKF
jgi:hypothetical protein